jgi:saccharopine dehydrogenase-like NADP-dependent oxidoreductase
VKVKNVDATSEASLLEVIRDTDIVVNTTGPYHLTAVPMIKAAAKSGKNYVDLDANVTAIKQVQALDKEVKSAGIAVCISFGDIPGIANIVTRYGANKLDEVEEIHIAAGGGRYRFPLVGIERLWRNIFASPVIYKDGKFVEVEPFSDPEVIQPPISAPFEVVVANMPTTLSMPTVFPKAKVVTFKTGMAPKDIGNDMLHLMFKWGFNSMEPIDVKGSKVTPADFAIAFLASDVHSKAIGLLDRATNDVSGTVYGGHQIRVTGKKNGHPARCTLGLWDPNYCMVESTCAFCAEQLATGAIKQKGVLVPEALDNPDPFMKMARLKGCVIRESFEHMM